MMGDENLVEHSTKDLVENMYDEVEIGLEEYRSRVRIVDTCV